mgnify:CR=1 FL=1|jgi:hypothetical protein
MKKILQSLICIAALALTSCSSVQVLDAWKSDNIGEMKNNNFLVVTRTQDKQARIALEDEIVNQMTANGFKASASYTVFPSFAPNNQEDKDDAALQKMLDSRGFDAVILTALKDYKEETRTTTSGGYYAGGNYSGYYPRYYGGFYGYYYHPYAYSSYGSYVPASSTTSTAQIYILETTIYDLTAPDENQLVAVVTSQVDDPQSITNVSADLVKKISKALD